MNPLDLAIEPYAQLRVHRRSTSSGRHRFGTWTVSQDSDDPPRPSEEPSQVLLPSTSTMS